MLTVLLVSMFVVFYRIYLFPLIYYLCFLEFFNGLIPYLLIFFVQLVLRAFPGVSAVLEYLGPVW